MKTIQNIIFSLFFSSACFAQHNEITLLKYSGSSAHFDKALLTLGEYHLKLSNRDSSINYFEQLNSILMQVIQKNDTTYIPFFIQLAKYYFQTGQFGESENFFQKAKYVFNTKIGEDHPEYANILSLLAKLYKKTGRLVEANQNYNETLQLLKKIGFENSTMYAITLTNQALLYIIQGNKSEAENLFIRAKTHMECTDNTFDLNYVTTLENLGHLYYNQLKLDEAETLYSKALQLRKSIHGDQDIDFVECLNNLANIQQKQGNDKLAESLYIQVLNIASLIKDNKVHPHLYNNLAMFYFHTNQLTKAENLFLKAKQLYENHFGKMNRTYLSLLDNIAELYVKLNNPAEASKYFIEASKLRKRIIYDSFKYLSSTESEEFLNGFNSNITNFNTFLLQYKDVSGLLLKEAYENELFFKGFLMNYHLELNNIIKTNPELSHISDTIKRIFKLIATEYTKYPKNISKIDSLKNVATHFEKQLGQKVSIYNDILRIVSFDDLSKILKPKEAIVEILHLNNYSEMNSEIITYAAMIIPYGSKAPILVNLCNEDEIQNLFLKTNTLNSDYVSTLYSSNTRGLKPVERTKNTLYKLVWEKIEIHLSGLKTIYYTPSGLLQKINIQAIPISEYKVAGDYYDIIQFTSSRQLLKFSNKREAIRSALVMGGIQYNETQPTSKNDIKLEAITRGIPSGSLEGVIKNYWTELNHTFRETYHVSQLLNKNKVLVNKYTGVDATEETFNKVVASSISPDIIHIATHGYFFPEFQQISDSALLNQNCPFMNSINPMMRSGLILAFGNYGWNNCQPLPGHHEDGILTAMEISQMNLHETQLAVLSACETGLGEIKGTEGVYGLQRAFKIAGVKNLILALWQVPDFQTEELMISFYSNLLENNMEIPQAFRKAQLEMKNKYNDPYFWAGFVLVQ